MGYYEYCKKTMEHYKKGEENSLVVFLSSISAQFMDTSRCRAFAFFFFFFV